MHETMIDLLADEMQDLYDAEKQLVKALPKMVKAASSEELSQALGNHLEQTQEQVTRLERAFEMIHKKPRAKACAAMKGLVSEAQERMQAEKNEPLSDLAMICAAQKVEHYEIAGYGTLKAWAEELGLEDVAGLLAETLNEEKEADRRLTGIAEDLLTSTSDETGDRAGTTRSMGLHQGKRA